MNFLNLLQGAGTFVDGKPGNAVGDFMAQLRQQVGGQGQPVDPSTPTPPMGGVPPQQMAQPPEMLPYRRPEGLLNKLAQLFAGGM